VPAGLYAALYLLISLAPAPGEPRPRRPFWNRAFGLLSTLMLVYCVMAIFSVALAGYAASRGLGGG